MPSVLASSARINESFFALRMQIGFNREALRVRAFFAQTNL